MQDVQNVQKKMRVVVLACAWVCVGTIAWGQPPADCKPNSLNIPGAPYPCIYPDNRVMFRVAAPEAQKVRVRLGQGFDMSKGPDGLWYVTTTQQVVGFHYCTLSIDGAVVADPTTRSFFGSGFYNSGIEVAEPDGDFYALKDVPRGQVRQRWYFSKVTGGWRRAYVYTPPDYDTNPKAKYPVLYLLHGWGEDEQGWHVQGHVDVIVDNLIAEKKAKPMIIVMDNLYAVKPGESPALCVGWPDTATGIGTARRLGTDRRRPCRRDAVVLRRGACDLAGRADADRLGERGGQPHVVPPHRGRMGRDADEELRRRQGRGDRGRLEARVSEQEHPYALLHVHRRIGVDNKIADESRCLKPARARGEICRTHSRNSGASADRVPIRCNRLRSKSSEWYESHPKLHPDPISFAYDYCVAAVTSVTRTSKCDLAIGLTDVKFSTSHQ